MKPITTGVLLMGDLSAEDLASLARQLEDWGYDYIWLADERFFREIYSCLTLCALNTKKIQIGVCVTDPYSRHPALTAMAIATLDEISEGRAVLGIGAGVSGFGELGIDRARPALAMREMVGLVRKLMTGENVDFQGRMVQFNHGALNFTPVRADLPIYVASNAPRGLQVAGELADGAIISGCAEEPSVDYAKGLIAKGTRKVGRDLAEIDLVARLNCCVSTDGLGARNSIRTATIRSLPGHLNFVTAAGIEVAPDLAASLSQMGYTHDDATLADMARRVPDHIIDAMTLAGTPEEVAQRVGRIVRRGVNQILVRPSPSPEGGINGTLEAFATQVMPIVRRELE
jgi:5,10-methylenetetrahydromethanopterin reductase